MLPFYGHGALLLPLAELMLLSSWQYCDTKEIVLERPLTGSLAYIN